MKAVKTLQTNNQTLTVLAEIDEYDKATISYFINGYWVKDWAKVLPEYQDYLTLLADHICKEQCAVKWTY